MNRISLAAALVFLLAGLSAADDDLADGTYIVLATTNGAVKFTYLLDSERAQDEISLFINVHGGHDLSAPEYQDRLFEEFVFEDAQPLPVRWKVAGYALSAGHDFWTPPDPAQVLPPANTEVRQPKAGFLALWQQRQQTRGDILLIGAAEADFYQPLVHRVFATLVSSTSPMAVLQEGDQFVLERIFSRGPSAGDYLNKLLKSKLSLEQKWDTWLRTQDPEVATLLAAGNYQRDGYGFFIDRGDVSGGQALATGANIEFTYEYTSLSFANLSGEGSHVAIVGRDRTLPVVDYFLRQVPAGENWTILVPPWLNRLDSSQKKDSSWYRYRVGVVSVLG